MALKILNKSAYPGIRNYILKNSGDLESVKEIYQEAIIILFEKVRKKEFDESKEVEGFLYTVARNKWISIVRKNKIHERFTNSTKQIATHDFETGHEILLKKEVRKEMKIIFNQLSESCQKIIEMATFQNETMDKIAKILGYSSRDVAKTSHYKCKKKLKELILQSATLKEIYSDL